jgi:hypothetical protein
MKSAPVVWVKIFNSGNSKASHQSGQTERIMRAKITHEEDAWKRFDRGISGLASVLREFHRDQPSGPDKRSAFP